MLITNPLNVRYLTGFTGSAGFCLIGQNVAIFFSDFRYRMQYEKQVDKSFRFVEGHNYFDLIVKEVKSRGFGRLFFEDESAQPKLDEIFQELARRIEEKLYLSSNYVYNHLLHCDVIFLDYQPIIGSSYIPLCPKLKYRKNCLLNIKNTNDNECLLLCIAASLFADKIDKRLKKRDNCNPNLY